MQVRLTTTVSTIINLGPGVTLEDAREEIFGRYNEDMEADDITQEVLERHSEAIASTEDEVIGTEVSHSFEEVTQVTQDE